MSVGDDDELRVQLVPVTVGHVDDRFGIFGETRVGHVRAEHRELGDQPRQRGRRVGARIDEPIEGRARNLELLRSAAQRPTPHHSRRRNQHRSERQTDEERQTYSDSRPEAAVPAYGRSKPQGVVHDTLVEPQ